MHKIGQGKTTISCVYAYIVEVGARLWLWSPSVGRRQDSNWYEKLKLKETVCGVVTFYTYLRFVSLQISRGPVNGCFKNKMKPCVYLNWHFTFLLQNLSILDDANFRQRWWRQKWNKDQCSSRLVTASTGFNGLICLSNNPVFFYNSHATRICLSYKLLRTCFYIKQYAVQTFEPPMNLVNVLTC